MAVTASDIAAVEAAYHDHADYAETGSVASAKAFATACRRMIGLVPKRSKLGGSGGGVAETEIDPASLRAELERALKWISQNDTSNPAAGGASYVDFSDFGS